MGQSPPYLSSCGPSAGQKGDGGWDLSIDLLLAASPPGRLTIAHAAAPCEPKGEWMSLSIFFSLPLLFLPSSRRDASPQQLFCSAGLNAEHVTASVHLPPLSFTRLWKSASKNWRSTVMLFFCISPPPVSALVFRFVFFTSSLYWALGAQRPLLPSDLKPSLTWTECSETWISPRKSHR